LYRVLHETKDWICGTEETDSEKKYINDGIDEDKFSYLSDFPDKDYTNANYLIIVRFNLCQFVKERLTDWLVCDVDSDRDTPQQVETLVRFFPELLDPHQFSDCFKSYPLMNKNLFVQMARREKAVSFIPLLAKLSLELHKDSGSVVGSRGGLLFYDRGEDECGLRAIVSNCNSSDTNEEDTRYLDVIKELRANNLLFKEDIQREDLLHCALNAYQLVSDFERVEFERRIRYLVEIIQYLVEWDPESLARVAESSKHIKMTLPLHVVTEESNPIRFRVLLELGIQHFPIQVGFLFQENSSGDSPFALASNKFGCSETKAIFENILATVANTPDDLLDSILYLATEESVDGVYVMLRRDPSILSRALLGSNRKRAREE